MAMQFDEFTSALDKSVQTSGAAAAFAGAGDKHAASWSLGARSVAVALVPPLNVSVTLLGGAAPDTKWYPVNPALVAVVSQRIAGYLNGA